MANSLKSAQYLIESRLLDAARGDANAYFDLGIAFSTGSADKRVTLISVTFIPGCTTCGECRPRISETVCSAASPSVSVHWPLRSCGPGP